MFHAPLRYRQKAQHLPGDFLYDPAGPLHWRTPPDPDGPAAPADPDSPAAYPLHPGSAPAPPRYHPPLPYWAWSDFSDSSWVYPLRAVAFLSRKFDLLTQRSISMLLFLFMTRLVSELLQALKIGKYVSSKVFETIIHRRTVRSAAPVTLLITYNS